MMKALSRRNGIKVGTLAAAAAFGPGLFRTANASQSKMVCLLTGCSSGFGRLTALELARRGHVVWASMRNLSTQNKSASDELLDIARRENLQLQTIELDVRNHAQQDLVFDEIVRESRRLDVLINNAGIIVCTPADCVTQKILDMQFQTNFYGPARLSSRALEVMSSQEQGHIITISSTVGRLNFPGISLYCASKHALESHLEVMSLEARESGVQFSLIQPGPYETRINPNAVEILERLTIPELKKERPMLYQKREQELRDLGVRFAGIPPFDPQEVATLIANRVEGAAPSPEFGLRLPVGHGHEFPVLRELNRVHDWAQNQMR